MKESKDFFSAITVTNLLTTCRNQTLNLPSYTWSLSRLLTSENGTAIHPVMPARHRKSADTTLCPCTSITKLSSQIHPLFPMCTTYTTLVQASTTLTTATPSLPSLSLPPLPPTDSHIAAAATFQKADLNRPPPAIQNPSVLLPELSPQNACMWPTRKALQS